MDTVNGVKKFSDFPIITEIQNPSAVYIPILIMGNQNENGRMNIPTLVGLGALEPIISVTVEQLVMMIKSGTLKPGQEYKITNFISSMYVPYCKTGTGNRVTNLDLLGQSYINYSPIVKALDTNKLSKDGRIAEYPDYAIGISFDVDEYYDSSRMPLNPSSYGVITYMEDKTKNFRCNFDFLNALVVTGGPGYCYYPGTTVYNPAAVPGAAGVNRFLPQFAEGENSFVAQRFFTIQKKSNQSGSNYTLCTQNAGDWHPDNTNYDYVSDFITKFGVPLSERGNTYGFINEIEGKLCKTTILEGKTGRYNFLIVNTAPNGTPDPLYEGSHCAWVVYSNRKENAFVEYKYRDLRNLNMRNVFIDRSPLSPLDTHYNKSNVPVVLFDQGYYVGTMTDYIPGSTGRGSVNPNINDVMQYVPTQNNSLMSNIHVSESDFVYIGKGSNLRIVNSYGISINEMYDSMIGMSFFCRLNTISGSTIVRTTNSYFKDMVSSKVEASNDIRITVVDNSAIVGCTHIQSWRYDSMLINSKLVNILSEPNDVVTTRAESPNDSSIYTRDDYYWYGKVVNLMGLVRNSEIANWRTIFCNGLFATLMGCVSVNNCKLIGNAGQKACIGVVGADYKVLHNLVNGTTISLSPSEFVSLLTVDEIATNNFDFYGDGVLNGAPFEISMLNYISEFVMRNVLMITVRMDASSEGSTYNQMLLYPNNSH